MIRFFNSKKEDHQQSNDFLLLARFKQIVYITLITDVVGLVIFLVQPGAHSYALDRSLSLLSFLSLIASNILSLYLVKKEKISLAIAIFLWSIAIIITTMLWLGGGLRDPGIAIYPALLMISALLGQFRHFVGILLFLVSMTLALTVAGTLNINASAIKEFSMTHVFDLILITTASCLVSWLFSQDFKKTLRTLKEENKKVYASQAKIDYLARHDPLTGLLRRAASNVHYQKMLSETNLAEENLLLYFLDLDNFKNINDSFDHSAGDTLLIEISNRLSSLLEAKDIASRVGGDEFLLIVVRPKHFSSHALAEAILRKVTQPVLLHNVEVDITTSIGIAVVPQDGTDFDDVRKKADIAMYKAKQQGKNTFYYYDDALHQKAIRKTQITTSLKKAIQNNLLELYFQPKIDIQTGAIIGAEALLRWVNDNPYQSTPDEFIPMIEATDTIIEIGLWVIQQACIHCKHWHNAGHTNLSIAVNVSGMQLARHNLKAGIDAALSQSKLPPTSLEIELTEHLLITGNNTVLTQLDSIKALGIDLAIDDFGTGYSSLSYLTKFQVDALKLDKSFISEMTHSAESLAIVKAIISMANIIGISTTAEGVEREEEWKILRQLGCQYGQGYLWGKALPNKQFMKLLEKKNKVFIAPLDKKPVSTVLIEDNCI